MPHLPYRPPSIAPDEGLGRGREFLERMDQRRSVRSFSSRAVPREMIATAIRTASTAPSGAHKQPWTFAAVSDPSIRRQIRVEAEAEERRNDEQRMNQDWLDALAALGTTADKRFLDAAPWLVVLFAQMHARDEQGERVRHYYVTESCGIAAGLFIASLHTMGLATLTHTPSPMGFLRKILRRPDHERPMLLFPVGYPSDDATVPDLQRKPLDEVSVWF